MRNVFMSPGFDSPLVFDISILHGKQEPISDVATAKDTLGQLEYILKRHSDTGIGLSAIQIGIPLQAGVIRWEDQKIDLINPVLVSGERSFIHRGEGCLSFPGIYYNIERFQEIIIDNHVIDGDTLRVERQYYCYDLTDKNPDLAAIAVQHEMDHMQGITIEERKIVLVPFRNANKVGRNDPCPCGSGTKYKKCCGVGK